VAIPFVTVGPVISVCDVIVEVGGVTLLTSVTFDVPRGTSLAVVGPSGSGKTTLLGCVSGTVVPTRGTVTVDGVDVSSLRAAARAKFRRERVGLIFQDPELLDELSVVENVALGLIFAGVNRRKAIIQAGQVLDRVGVGEMCDARTATLSGGEAQRVAVARALVKHSPVVVADEPTASLDAQNAAHVAELLLATARETSAALLLATHDSAVAGLCDRVLSLREVGVALS